MRPFALPPVSMLLLPLSAAAVMFATAGGLAWLTSASDVRVEPAKRVAPAPSWLRASATDPLLDEHADATPRDADAWQVLARARATQGQHALALPAFRRATQLRPDDAALLTDYAFSAASTSRRIAADDPQPLVERALQIAPTHPKALALAGALALDRNDYDVAVRHWERLMQLQPADSPSQRELRASIAQARWLADAQAGRIRLAGR